MPKYSRYFAINFSEEVNYSEVKQIKRLRIKKAVR